MKHKNLFLAVLLYSVISYGNTIVVTAPNGSIATDGLCSISEAIMAANTDTQKNECIAGNGNDTIILTTDIVLYQALDASYENTGTPTIDSLLTIDAQNHSVTRDINLACDLNFTQTSDEFRLFSLTSNANVTLSNIILENGCNDAQMSTLYGGGAIFNSGVLSIQNSIIRNNISSGKGGGIFCHTSSFTNNKTDIENSYLTLNSALLGGAIYYQINTIGSNITNSTFALNTATFGGAILVSVPGNIDSITNTTFSQNTGDAIHLLPHINNSLNHINSIINNTFIGNIRAIVGESAPDIPPEPALISKIGTINNNLFQNNEANCYGFSLTLAANNYSDNLYFGFRCGSSTSNILNTIFTNITDNGCIIPLADGTCIPTYALPMNSNAIDNSIAGTSSDQRGLNSFGTRDVGAFEYNGLNPEIVFTNGFE